MATAKERFEKLDSKRDQVVDRARQGADLTIPALMPPEGSDENTPLPTPYQSLGSRGVNNMASKLRLSLFPPGNPFFRLQMNKATEELLTGGAPQAKNVIDAGLRSIENDAMKLLESENHGVTLQSVAKQLIVSGNVLLHMPTEGGSRVFRLPNYVVVRDAMGNWTEIAAKETVSKETLSEKTREACIDSDDAANSDNPKDDEVDVFTWVRLVSGKVEWHQEINDIEVPGSKGRVADPKDSPYIPLRWSALENENYGRGHVEEYLGDLRSLEDISKSIVQFAAAAAKVIFLDKPNSSTDIEEIEKAESGDFVEGDIDDISVLQVEKFHDFQVVKATADDLTLRLSHAFLLQSGTVRDAERVTAEEIRAMAQELEDVLGGVYTVLAQELQLRVVRRLIATLKARGQFPKLPKGALNPAIVTGFDALGRGHELNRMRAYFNDGIQMFGEGFMGQFDPSAVAQVLATHHNVTIAGLLKTQEQLDQEGQQERIDNVTDKAAGPVAGKVAEAAAKQATGE